jgi:hypothetical protein
MVRPSSNRLNTGFQYTPVDSSATCVTCWLSNQSARANNSAVIVEKVRTSRWAAPLGCVIRTQATTVRL